RGPLHHPVRLSRSFRRPGQEGAQAGRRSGQPQPLRSAVRMTTVRSEDREDGVRVVTLDRPLANAITPTLLRDLSSALDEAREDDAVRAVILTGEGRFFSAGLDLRGGIDFQALSSTGTPTDPFLPLRSCLLSFLRFPKPTVGMLRGHSIAGGLILLLACDYRLGLAGDYRIGLHATAIGASFPTA